MLRKSTNKLNEVLSLPEGIELARNSLLLLADGLRSMANDLGEPFAAALDLLYKTKGRVIVTGIGKSGHIARKVAASFSSIGTPAFFVHPGEASHGDLGMIMRCDSVLAMSNSGETMELSSIVSYTRRFSIPLIVMTGGKQSSLAKIADVALIIPKVPESCPLGLAPTTSTCMMLALSDALAVALLERRGFTAEDYKVFHPGGSLGRVLVRVCDVMHRGAELPIGYPDQSMSEILLEMSAKGFGCVGLVDSEGRIVGIITDGDLRRHMSADLLQQSAASVMTATPLTINQHDLVVKALALMEEHKVTRLFVTEEEKLVGFIETRDCLRSGVV